MPLILLTLMTDAIHFPEKSVLTRTTRRHIPEDIIHTHCSGNLISYISSISFKAIHEWVTALEALSYELYTFFENSCC
jgi:hypothetical protein